MKIYDTIVAIFSAAASIGAAADADAAKEDIANADAVPDIALTYLTITVSTIPASQPLLAIQTIKAGATSFETHSGAPRPKPTSFITIPSAASRAKGKRGCFPTSHCDHEHHPSPTPSNVPKWTPAPRKSHVTKTWAHRVYTYIDTSVIDEDSDGPSDGAGGARKRFAIDGEVENEGVAQVAAEEAAQENTDGDDGADAASEDVTVENAGGDDGIDVTFYSDETDDGPGPAAIEKRSSGETANGESPETVAKENVDENGETTDETIEENIDGDDGIDVTFYSDENDDGSGPEVMTKRSPEDAGEGEDPEVATGENGDDGYDVTFYNEENDDGSSPGAITKRSPQESPEESPEETANGEDSEAAAKDNTEENTNDNTDDGYEIAFYTEENDDGSAPETLTERSPKDN